MSDLNKILVPKTFPLASTFGFDPKKVDPAITVQGYEIPDPATLGQDEAPYAQLLLSMVPAVDPLYHFRQDIVQAIYYWYLTGEDVLMLWGPTGSGKTSAWEQFCARLGIPMTTMKGHRDFKDHEAFGQMSLVDGRTTHIPGPATMAAEFGIPCVCNEFDRIPASRTVAFNDIFEGRPFPVPGRFPQMVSQRPGCRFVITANTNMVEDLTGNYSTAVTHDISILERMYAVRVDYPSAEFEHEMLAKAIAGFDDNFLRYFCDAQRLKIKTASGMKQGSAINRSELIDAAIQVATATRAQSKDGGNTADNALERTMSSRMLVKWFVNALKHAASADKLGKSALHIALDKYLASLATESTRLALHHFVEGIFGVGELITD
ncbi:MAG: hypothetical protein D4R84_02625 [Rhodocyclaceae bacterium]|nr:MAG: hypothetical protein D4R84_02625 [Rhodocyclaceae bacterium]